MRCRLFYIKKKRKADITLEDFRTEKNYAKFLLLDYLVKLQYKNRRGKVKFLFRFTQRINLYLLKAQKKNLFKKIFYLYITPLI